MGSDFRINLYRKEMMVDAYDVVDPKLSVKTDGSHIQNRNDFGTQSATNGIILNWEQGIIQIFVIYLVCLPKKAIKHPGLFKIL